MIPLMNPISGSVTYQRKPFSRVPKSRAVKEFGMNIIGIMGLMAVVLTFVTLMLIDPFTDFVMWVDYFAGFVGLLVLTGLFINYARK